MVLGHHTAWDLRQPRPMKKPSANNHAIATANAMSVLTVSTSDVAKRYPTAVCRGDSIEITMFPPKMMDESVADAIFDGVPTDLNGGGEFAQRAVPFQLVAPDRCFEHGAWSEHEARIFGMDECLFAVVVDIGIDHLAIESR